MGFNTHCRCQNIKVKWYNGRGRGMLNCSSLKSKLKKHHHWSRGLNWIKLGKNGELDESFPTVYGTQVKLMKSEYRYNSSGMYIDKKDDVVVFLNTAFWVVI